MTAEYEDGYTLTEMSLEELFEVAYGASPDDVWAAHMAKAKANAALQPVCD